MVDEPEVIREQMNETRTNLTEKIDLLERHLVDTVQGTSAAVAETVDSVKESVDETVQAVKESVRETVSSVKETFDLARQVERRPWTIMAGAVAVGFLGGRLLARSRGEPVAGRESYRPMAQPFSNGKG